MTRSHLTHRLLALWLAGALGLPPPALALKIQEVREGTGLEELARTLDFRPQAAAHDKDTPLTDTQQKLVEQSLPLVKTTIRWAHGAYGALPITDDELFADLSEALVGVAQRYQRDRATFETLAHERLQGVVKDLIRQRASKTRHGHPRPVVFSLHVLEKIEEHGHLSPGLIGSADPMHAVEEAHLQRALQEAITSLPPQLRGVVKLQAAGVAVHKIGAAMGVNHPEANRLLIQADYRLVHHPEVWKFRESLGGTVNSQLPIIRLLQREATVLQSLTKADGRWLPWPSPAPALDFSRPLRVLVTRQRTWLQEFGFIEARHPEQTSELEYRITPRGRAWLPELEAFLASASAAGLEEVGDPSALVQAHLDMIDAAITHVLTKVRVSATRRKELAVDLYAEGYLALHRLAERYDPRRGATFRTYAFGSLPGYLLHALRARGLVLHRGRSLLPETPISQLSSEAWPDEFDQKLGPSRDDPFTQTWQANIRDAVTAAATQLPVAGRQFVQGYLDGYSPREIANARHTSEHAVRRGTYQAFYQMLHLPSIWGLRDALGVVEGPIGNMLRQEATIMERLAGAPAGLPRSAVVDGLSVSWVYGNVTPQLAFLHKIGLIHVSRPPGSSERIYHLTPRGRDWSEALRAYLTSISLSAAGLEEDDRKSLWEYRRDLRPGTIIQHGIVPKDLKVNQAGKVAGLIVHVEAPDGTRGFDGFIPMSWASSLEPDLQQHDLGRVSEVLNNGGVSLKVEESYLAADQAGRRKLFLKFSVLDEERRRRLELLRSLVRESSSVTVTIDRADRYGLHGTYEGIPVYIKRHTLGLRGLDQQPPGYWPGKRIQGTVSKVDWKRGRLEVVFRRLMPSPKPMPSLARPTTVDEVVSAWQPSPGTPTVVIAVGPSVLQRLSDHEAWMLRAFIEQARRIVAEHPEARFHQVVEVPEDPGALDDLAVALSYVHDQQPDLEIRYYRLGEDAALELFTKQVGVFGMSVQLQEVPFRKFFGLLQAMDRNLRNPSAPAGLEELRELAGILDALA